MIKQQSAISRQLSAISIKKEGQAGFTLVELMITMVIFVLVIAAASQIFTGLLTQFKQQSKIAETNVEGIVGLEILRQDIEHAGYGLPWNVTGVADADDDGKTWEDLANYSEAAALATVEPNPANLNDSTRDIDGDGNAGEAPRAILIIDNADFNGASNIFDGSDYLVIKAVNVARNDAAQRWTRLSSDGSKRNGLSGDDFADTDRVIVISPGNSATNSRSLVVIGGAFYTRYNNTAGFAPSDATDTRIIYGADGDTDLTRMPFNRADYYIWRDGTTVANDGVPDRCALGTGILRKAVISQADGQRQNPLPLLDCVADMQVIFRRDTGAYTNDLSTLNDTNANGTIDAQEIREQVREVRVYILAHEGQRDVNYTFTNFSDTDGDGNPNPPFITVGEFGMGRNFDLTTITDNLNYRWKVYTIVVKPNNLE